MSVIAWDCATLAADRRALRNGLIRTVQKIWCRNGCLVGYTGDSDAGEEKLAWWGAGADPSAFVESMRKDDSTLVVVLSTGFIQCYERTPYPVIFPAQHMAFGSGRDYAMAAMHCGRTAREAVEIASHFDYGCGNGCDVLSFGDDS
jgi:hypothetical protein